MSAGSEALHRLALRRQPEHAGAPVSVRADVVEVPEAHDLASGACRQAVDARAGGQIGVPEQDLRKASAAEPAVEPAVAAEARHDHGPPVAIRVRAAQEDAAVALDGE
ncbi:MAG TPA: hypothetical protein VFB44_08900 [Thermoleophilaceae bacterium]|nr:hypothetical protein [Thermoleophilaceae bacterium]